MQSTTKCFHAEKTKTKRFYSDEQIEQRDMKRLNSADRQAKRHLKSLLRSQAAL